MPMQRLNESKQAVKWTTCCKRTFDCITFIPYLTLWFAPNSSDTFDILHDTQKKTPHNTHLLHIFQSF